MGEELVDSSKNSYDEFFERVWNWWNELHTQKSSGNRAILRKARSPNEIASLSTYYSLYGNLIDAPIPNMLKSRMVYRLPLVAGLLSHIKQDDPDRSVAAAMGSKKPGSENAIVSDLRFRRILRVEDDDELYLMMLRLIRMLGEIANVRDTAHSMVFWNANTKKKWASQYYLKRDIYS